MQLLTQVYSCHMGVFAALLQAGRGTWGMAWFKTLNTKP